MREPVPLTNAIAARMIASARSGRGGNHAILGSLRTSVPTAADGVTEATVANARAITAAKSLARAGRRPGRERLRMTVAAKHHSARWLLAVV